MIDTLFSLNLKLSNNNNLLERSRMNSVGRFAVRFAANNILPIYLRGSKGASLTDSQAVPVVVSLTSFPARIGKLWMIIECMLRQVPCPERIVLWLSRDQFPNGLNDLPKELTERQSRGLEIRFVEGDIRSHKKYYYAFSEFCDKYVLTIDDDLILPSKFVGDVYQCALQHPDSVIANFGSYFYWDKSIGYLGRIDRRIMPGETGKHLFFGSGGGTLFRPARLAPFLDDISIIRKLCPTADDIYLNAITHLSGQNVTFMSVSPLLSINNKGDEKLTDHNGNLYDPFSKNADQLRALVTYLVGKWGKNPFDEDSKD